MFSIWISNRNYGMMLDPPRGMRLIGQLLSEVLRHAKLCERYIALLTTPCGGSKRTESGLTMQHVIVLNHLELFGMMVGRS